MIALANRSAASGTRLRTLVLVRGRTDSRRRGDFCFAGSSCRPLAGILLAPASGGLVQARGSTSEGHGPVRPKHKRAERDAPTETTTAPAPTARLHLGDSASDELLGAAEIRTPAYRRSDRTRGMCGPWRRSQCRRGGVRRMLPRDRARAAGSAGGRRLPTQRPARVNKARHVSSARSRYVPAAGY